MVSAEARVFVAPGLSVMIACSTTAKPRRHQQEAARTCYEWS